jgi:hypothetical protein
MMSLRPKQYRAIQDRKGPKLHGCKKTEVKAPDCPFFKRFVSDILDTANVAPVINIRTGRLGPK